MFEDEKNGKVVDAEAADDPDRRVERITIVVKELLKEGSSSVRPLDIDSLPENQQVAVTNIIDLAIRRLVPKHPVDGQGIDAIQKANAKLAVEASNIVATILKQLQIMNGPQPTNHTQ